MITIFFDLIITLLRIYSWAVLIAAVLSMLISFNVLDTRNRFVWQVSEFFYRVTEPALRPIRSVLPAFGGIDFSPWVLWLSINWVAIPVLARIETAILFHSAQPLLF